MVTRVGSYHKNCFSCFECNKKLVDIICTTSDIFPKKTKTYIFLFKKDSLDCCEGPDSEIYCKSCYALVYGTKSRSRAASIK